MIGSSEARKLARSGAAEADVEMLCARCEVAGHDEAECEWADKVYDAVMLNG